MTAADVDAYLARLSPENRSTLEKVRKAIKAVVPGAEEGLRYGMPVFVQGQPIAGYAASANHCAYYPMSGAIVSALKADLAGYATSKGAIRFPVAKPLAATLIRKLVKARIQEVAAAKPKKKRAAVVGQTDADVVAFLRELDHPLRKEIGAARRAILGVSPAIREGIKWNAPSFRTDKQYFATFNLRSKDDVQLVLHLGAKARPDQKAFKVADPKGLMTWLGKDRALLRLGVGRSVASNRAALEAIVRAWIKQV